MEYREFGKTGAKVSILGFGAMRLPMDEDNGKHLIREEESLKMIIRSFELGTNYIDTAFTYCYEQSELIVGKALKLWKSKNKQSNIYLSTKLPTWKITKTSDFWFYLEKQLTRLDVRCIDFYHIHHLTEDYFEEKIIKLNMEKEILKAKDQKMIRHISFSFHDSPGTYMLTKKESAIINKFLSQKELGELIPCTNCKYCLPCPSDVNIPKILKLMNYCTVTGLKDNASWQYKDIVLDNASKLADSCTECGECEEKCPQGIKIVDKLKETHNALG